MGLPDSNGPFRLESPVHDIAVRIARHKARVAVDNLGTVDLGSVAAEDVAGLGGATGRLALDVGLESWCRRHDFIALSIRSILRTVQLRMPVALRKAKSGLDPLAYISPTTRTRPRELYTGDCANVGNREDNEYLLVAATVRTNFGHEEGSLRSSRAQDRHSASQPSSTYLSRQSRGASCVVKLRQHRSSTRYYVLRPVWLGFA